MQIAFCLSYQREMVNEDSLPSVLSHGNDVFVNKVLSRSSSSCDAQYSLPRKSETYYCKLPGTVPFQWELQPGIPKDPPEEKVQASIPLESSSLRLKKNPSSMSNDHQQNHMIIKKSHSSSSWFFRKSKKSSTKSATFSHSKKSSNLEDHGFFSSSSSCASKSSSSTSARDESPTSKALAKSSPMSSRFRSLYKRMFRRLF